MISKLKVIWKWLLALLGALLFGWGWGFLSRKQAPLDNSKTDERIGALKERVKKDQEELVSAPKLNLAADQIRAELRRRGLLK